MSFFHKRPDWYLPERLATSESDYVNRRQILKAMGWGGLGLLSGGLWQGCTGPGEGKPEGGVNGADGRIVDGGGHGDVGVVERSVGKWKVGDAPHENYPSNAQGIGLYPPRRNENYKVSERILTPENAPHTYNNFYEFSTSKRVVWELTGKFETTPWTIEFGGLVNKPLKLDVETIIKKLGLEERVYRHRCVEAWAMTVPWAGFSLSRLLKLADVQSSAKYVRFLSEHRPDQMPGLEYSGHYPWPFHEALRLDEAHNDLAFVATGVYGRPLSRQMGAPIRVVTPWKYGYKSIKSIIKIEFTSVQPKTFWNTAVPEEYGFYSNVNPKKPHPRWSQAVERLIPEMKEVPTQPYNGYAAQVSSLYTGKED